MWIPSRWWTREPKRVSESTFSDALAIYQLSLSVDFDYSELREREYPLLAPQALADRLRLAARCFLRIPDTSLRFAIGAAPSTGATARRYPHPI